MELDLEIARQPHSSKVVSATLAFRHLADNSRVLDLLLRDEVSFDRQFTRALNALIKLRPIPAMCGQDETPVDETKVARGRISKRTETAGRWRRAYISEVVSLSSMVAQALACDD